MTLRARGPPPPQRFQSSPLVWGAGRAARREPVSRRTPQPPAPPRSELSRPPPRRTAVRPGGALPSCSDAWCPAFFAADRGQQARSRSPRPEQPWEPPRPARVDRGLRDRAPRALEPDRARASGRRALGRGGWGGTARPASGGAKLPFRCGDPRAAGGGTVSWGVPECQRTVGAAPPKRERRRAALGRVGTTQRRRSTLFS
jgi:hypothetical protein